MDRWGDLERCTQLLMYVWGGGFEGGSEGEDVIYKVSVERWPLQQLPPAALDGIITPFWCIEEFWCI